MTPEEEAEFKRRRRARNYALGGFLFVLVILFFLVTLERLPT